MEAVEETLRKTTLGALAARRTSEPGARVADGGPAGRASCAGSCGLCRGCAGVEKRAMSWMVRVSFPREFARYVIPVGSMAVDGISLTVASVEGNRSSYRSYRTRWRRPRWRMLLPGAR